MGQISRVGLYSVVFIVLILGSVGANPIQNERPPQPFFQDFFSGRVTLEGLPPPEGTLLIACIDDCGDGFESEPYYLKADGIFDQLEVKPMNQGLVGHIITFYLVNNFGRIKAIEERPYIGVFDFYVQNLTFDDAMPGPNPTPTLVPTGVPTPTASLPIAGDPMVTKFPKAAFFAGLGGVVLGGMLLLCARRKNA